MRKVLIIFLWFCILEGHPICQPDSGKIDPGETLSRTNLIHQLESANELALAWHPDSALDLCLPLVEITKSEFGKNDSTYARALEVLGTCYYYLGEYDRCDTLFEEILRIRTGVFDLGDFRIINVIFRLGQIYSRQVKLAKAEEYLTKAIALWEKYFGVDYKKYGTALGELGELYLIEGDFSKAEEYCRRWVKISGNLLGENHPNYGSAVKNLATLYCRHADWEKARLQFQKALEIFESNYGPIHPVVARCLMGLGDIAVKQRRFDMAGDYYDRALKIRRGFFMDFHPEIAECYARIAALDALQGKFAPAESLYNRAIEIDTLVNGPEHIQVCESMRQLGMLIANNGRFEEGKALVERSLEIRMNAQGPHHYRIPSCFDNLALINCYLGDYNTGREYYRRLLDSRLNFLKVIFAGASEDQKLRYAGEYSIMEHSLFSMAIIDGSRESRKLALEMLLNGKAFVLDAVAAEKKIAYCKDDDRINIIVDRLSDIYREIASLTLLGSNDSENEIYGRRLNSLYEIKDSLETIMSEKCSEYNDVPDNNAITSEDVASALPPQGVLWEFARYRPFDFAAKGGFMERTGQPGYLVFTLNHEGDIRLFVLGGASVIDSLINESLVSIDKAPEKIYLGNENQSELELIRTTSSLYDIVFAPLAEDLDEDAEIYISPDGNLNLFPLGILPCPDSEYVVEKYHLSYLSSGRDLLKINDSDSRSEGHALVVADPDFDMNMKTDNKTQIRQSPNVDLTSFLPVRAGDCLTNYWSPLPETFHEGEIIADLLNKNANYKVEFSYGSAASERLLKNLDSPPEILHMATHGYYCPDGVNTQGNGVSNPLLGSGLVLSGANRVLENLSRTEGQGEDGILTSLEISGLNLAGTDLAVLSACQSGSGEVMSGEGIFGLRRAFQHAGVRSIIMSLWSIPDKQTRQFMTYFYGEWLSGELKSEALRNASLRIISDRREKYGAAHPLFWGGFILAGDSN